ncbi:NUDIX domain-containing protein [uncultured Pseudokineococcus sp.]|uniref:NUDIX domain-containing protein n=1 Tax=uncultured Pseudokineococcus sp. TaxID=1642928 RepID=UPI0026130AA2|nr:NUDIX domain-containing protein [uncultured Pseudokineococcus sp.]
MDEGNGRHVVVTAALRRGGRVLLAHRSPGRDFYPDAWDLPGGHVEPGEAPRAALARELAEELGVVADVVGEPVARLVADDLVMDVWVVDAWRGEVLNRQPHEHDALEWCDAAELSGRALAHADLGRVLRGLLAR